MDNVSLWSLLAVLAVGLWFAWQRMQSGSGSSAFALSKGRELARIDLSGGDRLVIAVDHDVRTISCRRERDGAPADVLALPCPGAGVAGARICLAPSGRVAIVALHSGQGEEGYVAVDETEVVMAVPFACTEWWRPWDEGEEVPEGAGRRAFPFGEVRVQDLASGRVEVCRLRVSAPDGWSPRREPYDPDLRPRFLADGLQITLPWRSIVLALPLPATRVVAVDGPPEPGPGATRRWNTS